MYYFLPLQKVNMCLCIGRWKIFVVLSFKRTRKDLVDDEEDDSIIAHRSKWPLTPRANKVLAQKHLFDNLHMRNKMWDGLQWCHGCIFVCEKVTQTVVRTVEGGQILPKMADHSPRVWKTKLQEEGFCYNAKQIGNLFFVCVIYESWN